LTRRIPKLKGFKRYYKLVTNYTVINLDALNDFRAGTTVTKEKLVEKSLLKDVNSAVKIL
jgi:ribosomal protein L15